MATFAIGDVQGCFEPLQRLLQRIDYRRDRDRLCFVGDLVNRGPQSLDTLRFMVDQDVTAVLGNHDIYALARAFDVVTPTSDDTLNGMWSAPDRDALLAWLVSRPVLHDEPTHTLVHAGLLPAWTLDTARAEARHIEHHLANDPKTFLARYFQRARTPWTPLLTGSERAVAALSVFIRIRFVDAQNHPVSGSTAPERPPHPAARPWFTAGRWDKPIAFGHWAALGLWVDERFASLDSGCVWGSTLTAMNLENRNIMAVSARAMRD